MPLSQLLKSSCGGSIADLQLILNAVVEGFCGLDAGGNVTFCNDALLKMTGYRAEEIIGTNLHELLHHTRPDGTKCPAEQCAIRNAMSVRQAIHVVGELFWRKDKTSFPTEYWLHPLPKPSSLTEYVATIQDITEIQRAQDAIRQGEEKFRRILASVPDVTWTSDQHGRTIYISPKVEAIFGYTQPEIYAGGSSLWLGRIHAEDLGRVQQAYRDLFEKRAAFDQEYRICRKDGVWIWVHDRATETHQQNGVLYAHGILSDITRRKQAEAELQSKTAFLEAQANSTIDGILVVNGCNQRILLNQRFVELLKVPPDVVASKDDGPLLEYVVSLTKDPKSFLARIKHLNCHPDETSRDEIEFKDGMILDRYSSPVVDENGIYYGRIWTFRDITERKRNEDVLRQLSIAVEQSPVSVVITDPQGDISYVNRKFTECTGYRPEEVLGKNPRVLKSGRNSADLYRNLWSTITQGHEWHGEFCNQKKNGDLYWEAATITPITNPNGAITHFLALKENITQRRRAEEALKASEKRYRLLFQRNLAGVLRSTPEGRVLECNQATARIFGYDSPEEVLALPAAEFYHQSSDREAFLTQLKSEKSLTNYEMRFRGKDGDSVWVIANFSLVDDESGGIVEGTLVDITERKRAEEELRTSEERYRLLFERNMAGIFRTTLDGRVLECNPTAAQFFGYNSPEEALGLSIADAYHGPLDREILLRKLKSEKCLTNYEIRLRRKNGDSVWAMLNISLIDDDSGAPSFLEGTFVDITERKLAEERVQSLAYYDALTGLPNRILLRDRLSKALAMARRQKHKVALLFLDLDRFKIINDSLGHSVGDLLLQEVAERLTRCARDQDTVARLGGDEFLIVLTKVKDIPDAAVAAGRFMDAMTSGFVIRGHSLSVSASLGISIFPEHGADSETLIKNADAAMYSAKDAGRNNLQFFTSDMNAQAVERLNLENGLRLALASNELFLAYQPQMEIATGKVTGVEALLRWQHPQLGLVPPDKFIRIAENSGLIMPIGEWVLRTACSQARQWQAEGLVAVSVAVNVSAVQFRQEGFPETVRRVLHETGLSPQYLELELTESLLLSNADVMFSVLQELKAMGLRLAIDDFGTGYSSLSYLKQFPVSKLKIDRSFIRDVALNPDDAAITSAIISMAKSLNLKVIAEGVENEAQMSFLRAHQCDEIQGYYFSKPVAADEMTDKLRANYSEAHLRAQSKRACTN